MDAVTAIGAVNGSQQLTAGGMASGVQYDYEMGPDGKMYAVGGKVRIIVTPGQTPEETLAKARELRAAANAPADPSGQDLTVAARASQMEAEALQKIAKERTEQGTNASSSRLPPSLRGLDRKA